LVHTRPFEAVTFKLASVKCGDVAINYMTNMTWVCWFLNLILPRSAWLEIWRVFNN
jgi:hypothetical protein